MRYQRTRGIRESVVRGTVYRAHGKVGTARAYAQELLGISWKLSGPRTI